MEAFERTISVDEVGRFKPAAETYHHAADVLGVAPDEVLMVAAHDWDVVGARAASLDAAYLARPATVWGLPNPRPPLLASDLLELAELVTRE